MTRPRIALVITTWYEASHADVLATGLVKGYDWNGGLSEPRVEVVSAYLEQRGISQKGRHKPDVGVEFLAQHGVPLYPTPAEALGAGAPGVNVDGVLIIAEHGDYEDNEYGQKLYPRRRLFDSCLSAMIAADRFVPVFNDKHLAWNFTDAKADYDNARRLGVPLLAGSTIPIAWRKPQGAEWPYGAPMNKAVCAAFSGFEVYGYHALEGLQAFTERRAGGESGAVEVRGFADDQAAGGVASIDPELLRAAVAAALTSGADGATDGAEVSPDAISAAIAQIKHVVTIRHADGLESAMVLSDGLKSFGVAATGPEQATVTAEMHLQPGWPHSHFLFLGRAAETMYLTGQAPYPVERTLFTGGVLDHAIRNARGVVDHQTPHLDIAYTVPEHIPDTGVYLKPYVHASN